MIDTQIKSYQFAGLPLSDVCNNSQFKYKTDYMNPSQWKADMQNIYTALSAVRLTAALAGALAVLFTFLM